MNINTKKYYDLLPDDLPKGGGVPDEVMRKIEEEYPLTHANEWGIVFDSRFAPKQRDAAQYGYSLASEKLKEQEQEIERLKAENERLRGEVDIPSAIKVLTKAMLEDKSEGSYYYSWQANIAMSFIDEYQRLNPHMSDGNKHILHTIANNAAKNFLDLLCLITPSPTTKK